MVCMVDLALTFMVAIIVALPIGRITDHRGQQGVFMVVMAGILKSLTWSLIVRENSTVCIHSILRLVVR